MFGRMNAESQWSPVSGRGYLHEKEVEVWVMGNVPLSLGGTMSATPSLLPTSECVPRPGS